VKFLPGRAFPKSLRLKSLNLHQFVIKKLKDLIKRLLEVTFPTFFEISRAIRIRYYFKRRFGKIQRQFRSQIFNTEPVKILSGPFSGVLYIDETVWGPITPKWLGSYEQELHFIIDKIIAGNYSTIIDVGSAEGYYVSGLAHRKPTSRIYSFDVDPISRKQQQRLIQLNGLTNVSIMKFCSYDDLESLIDSNTFILVDIEGHEYSLLNPEKAPALKKASILVELHPFREVTDMAKELRARFENSHTIETIDQMPRDFGNYKSLLPINLSEDEMQALADEHRPASQQWLWMESTNAS
jgi:hypothetical protein